jgi:hypothetical protein
MQGSAMSLSAGGDRLHAVGIFCLMYAFRFTGGNAWRSWYGTRMTARVLRLANQPLSSAQRRLLAILPGSAIAGRSVDDRGLYSRREWAP